MHKDNLKSRTEVNGGDQYYCRLSRKSQEGKNEAEIKTSIKTSAYIKIHLVIKMDLQTFHLEGTFIILWKLFCTVMLKYFVLAAFSLTTKNKYYAKICVIMDGFWIKDIICE